MRTIWARDFFQAGPGMIVPVDYSGIEMRIYAEATRTEVLKDYPASSKRSANLKIKGTVQCRAHKTLNCNHVLCRSSRKSSR